MYISNNWYLTDVFRASSSSFQYLKNIVEGSVDYSPPFPILRDVSRRSQDLIICYVLLTRKDDNEQWKLEHYLKPVNTVYTRRPVFKSNWKILINLSNISVALIYNTRTENVSFRILFILCDIVFQVCGKSKRDHVLWSSYFGGSSNFAEEMIEYLVCLWNIIIGKYPLSNFY